MHPRDLEQLNISTIVRKDDFIQLAKMFSIQKWSLMTNMISYLSPTKAAQMALENFTKVRDKKFRPRGIFETIKPEVLPFNDKYLAIYHFKTEKPNAPKVLLAHGWTGQASDFYRIIPKFLEAGLDVIAFDGPAHGQSTGTHTHMFEFADSINTIAEKFGPINFALGHSMGGVAISLASITSKFFKPEKMIIMGSPNKMKVVFEKFTEMLGLNQKILEAILIEAEKVTGFKIENIQLQKMLKDHDADILLVYDVDDKVVPVERAYEILEHAKNVNFLKTFGLGHVKFLREENVIIQLRNFFLGSRAKDLVVN